MKYTVGEVAKPLGITPNALRFYDNEGILKTQKEENGRRFYDQLDLTRLLSCKKYSAMGVPLKTIGVQFSEGGDRKEAIEQRLVDCEREAREKAAFYQNLADDIAAHIETSAQMRQRYGEIRIETSPACLLLFDEENQLITRDTALQKQMQRWIAAMPATKLASVYLSDDTQSGEATLAYSILADRAQQAGLDADAPGVLFAPPRPSLHVMCSHYGIFTEPQAPFATVFPYLREKGLRLDGLPWAQVIVAETDENDTYHVFADVWVPFCL